MNASTPPWWGPDGILGTADDYEPSEAEKAHFLANADVPDDQVACIQPDGSILIRPVGGRVDVDDGDDA